MHRESSDPRETGGARLERAIVLQLLSEDSERKWSRAELESELGPDASLDAALRALHGQGVVVLADEQVWASPAVRRLDELELIGI